MSPRIEAVRTAAGRIAGTTPRTMLTRRARDRDVDPVAVERAVRGEIQPWLLSFAERERAVAVLTEANWSSRRIAVRLGLAPRSVQRHRARLRARTAA